MSNLLRSVHVLHVFEVFLFETLDELDLTSSGSLSNQPASDENPRTGIMCKVCLDFLCMDEAYPETCILSS